MQKLMVKMLKQGAIEMKTPSSKILKCIILIFFAVPQCFNTYTHTMRADIKFSKEPYLQKMFN